MSQELVLSVTDFVALLNQTLEFAYPSVTIVGELSSLRVSKNRWVYFDLKDEFSNVKFFGTVYQLPGPLEDGLMLQVRGVPRLHPQFGFSVNIQFISPVGEGSIKKAANLLQAKLLEEGLFDPVRKRMLPYPPSKVGLITSSESAAFHDFSKILNERWIGVDVQLADVQVQGETAVDQIIRAIEYFNSHSQPVDVLVITRGGGSADDLAVFNTEQVTRAVAASRIPTLVAIGHEVNISLAEMAADQRASTPSNAVQILVPDKKTEKIQLKILKRNLLAYLQQTIFKEKDELKAKKQTLNQSIQEHLAKLSTRLSNIRLLLHLINPETILKKGYAVLRRGNMVVKSVRQLKPGDGLNIRIVDGQIESNVTKVEVQ